MKRNDKPNDKPDDKPNGFAAASSGGKAPARAEIQAGTGVRTNDKPDGPGNATPHGQCGAQPNRAPARDCVLCGCCLEGCPLLAATGREELSPRAKALLAGPSKIAAATQKGGLNEAAAAKLAGLCLSCGRCEALCPQGVSVPELVASLRAAHPDFRRWLWKQWVGKLSPYWGLVARGAGLVPEALTPAKLGLALKGLRGLAPDRGLRPWLAITRFPTEGFREKWDGRPVALFDGCVGAGPRKAWADTARFLLRGLGAGLATADFSCCGSSLGSAGLPEDQHRARRTNVEAWRRAGRPLLATYCATCRKGLAGYGAADLFADAAEAALWAGSVTPLSTLLAGAEGKILRGAPPIAGWHRPCHADAGDVDFALLKSLLGTRLRAPARSACCGFGGIMQLAAPDLSAQVAGACWANLDTALGFTAAPEAAPAYVLTGCSGCVAQLLATPPPGARAGHWLEIIRRD